MSLARVVMSKAAGSKHPSVLQGYFRIERFRGLDLRPAKMRGGAAQPKQAPSGPRAPRPDLLPAKMRGHVGQTKTERGPGLAWSGALRPELLPGMGSSSVGRPSRVAQARANDGVLTTPVRADQLRVIGQGRPLDPGIRQTMEAFFLADFSGVRVHEGPAAPAIGALAFTLGEELHFAPGLYDPGNWEGVQLLGHELAHVVQQRDGRVVNPYGQGVAIVQDPGLEAEADAMGRQVADEILSVESAQGPEPFAGIQFSGNGGSGFPASATGQGARRWTTNAALAQARPAAFQPGGPITPPGAPLQASWASIVGTKAPDHKQPQPPPPRPNLVDSINDHLNELQRFAQEKISSAITRMYKGYLKFRIHHKPSDDMVCTLM